MTPSPAPVAGLGRAYPDAAAPLTAIDDRSEVLAGQIQK